MAQAPATRRRTAAAAPARSRLMTAGIGLLGVALGLGGWLLARQQRDARAGDVGTGEHVPVDLALDKPHPGPRDRAPEAFRPDPTAPVPAGERDALRPATGPAPSLVQDRGSMRSQTGSSNA